MVASLLTATAENFPLEGGRGGQRVKALQASSGMGIGYLLPHPIMGCRERRKLPQQRPRWSPGPKVNLVYFSITKHFWLNDDCHPWSLKNYFPPLRNVIHSERSSQWTVAPLFTTVCRVCSEPAGAGAVSHRRSLLVRAGRRARVYVHDAYPRHHRATETSHRLHGVCVGVQVLWQQSEEDLRGRRVLCHARSHRKADRRIRWDADPRLLVAELLTHPDSCLTHLIPPKRDLSIYLCHTRLYELPKTRTVCKMKSFLPYCLYGFTKA